MGHADVTPEMLAAIVCREMKWTFEEYETQPASFVDTIVLMLQAEASETKRRANEKGS